ncbi:hypothetical protein [Polaromonas sp.]|uniref:hypothetical protein n=1 Tax=Polaromonas sp. TaxID=1869339 RepID=UPI00286C68BA|nr:hypothetical protein [Polaromonas sp.]
MFDRLKTSIAQGKIAVTRSHANRDVAQWAAAQGFLCTVAAEGKGFGLTGEVGDKPWKMECGSASRDYIRGRELRARAELRIKEDVSVVIMNRSLKEVLEKRAYESYTDTLQTAAAVNLTEEMRWLAMYPEVGWDGPPQPFWNRYAVMAEHSHHAADWLDPLLAELLLSWPQPGPDAQVPVMLMLLRGKAYLRMQYTPADLPTLAHATHIFTRACQSAIDRLSTDLAI